MPTLAPDGQFTRNEAGPARRAARLGVVVGKDGAFGSQLVDVRRCVGHQTAMVGADVPYSDVIPHNHNNVRLFLVTHVNLLV